MWRFLEIQIQIKIQIQADDLRHVSVSERPTTDIPETCTLAPKSQETSGTFLVSPVALKPWIRRCWPTLEEVVKYTQIVCLNPRTGGGLISTPPPVRFFADSEKNGGA